MKHRVLLVEDETKTAEILKQALELEKTIEVIWVNNGKGAIEAMEKGRYNLVVLDLKLPGLTGDEVLAHIRKSDPYVEVVIYTNYLVEANEMKRLTNLGVDGYIQKGAEADLWETVKTIKKKLDR